MNILDPAFRYVPSHSTDIRKRFAAERERIAAQAAKPQPLHVVPNSGHKAIFNARRGK